MLVFYKEPGGFYLVLKQDLRNFGDDAETVVPNKAMSAPSQLMDTTKGTLFGVYKGITGYFQNVKQYKNEETKLKSVMLGGVAQLRTQAAFNLCMDRMSLC